LQVVPFKYFWPPGVGLPGWVLVHKVPYVMNDAQSDNVIIPEIRERFGVNTAIDTPILDAQGEVIGFFEVNNKKNGGGFAESDVEKLVAVSHIASIALQNAMSYRNLERAEKALRESQLQLQLLSRQLLQAQEVERRAIARELHDEIGQQLSGVGILLSIINRQLPSELAQARLETAQALVGDLIAQVRNLALNLRPAILDDFGLMPALVWLFERYTTQTQIAVQFEHPELEEQRFAPEVETTAYRIVQEALTNVARHAGVTEVTVRLWIDADTFWVVVADQGRGFVPQTVDTRTSSGLAGMVERAALLGGNLTIESAPGTGTHVTTSLPLHSDGEPRGQEHDA
jgi:signal transduction histidine kinase